MMAVLQVVVVGVCENERGSGVDQCAWLSVASYRRRRQWRLLLLPLPQPLQPRTTGDAGTLVGRGVTLVDPADTIEDLAAVGRLESLARRANGHGSVARTPLGQSAAWTTGSRRPPPRRNHLPRRGYVRRKELAAAAAGVVVALFVVAAAAAAIRVNRRRTSNSTSVATPWAWAVTPWACPHSPRPYW